MLNWDIMVHYYLATVYNIILHPIDIVVGFEHTEYVVQEGRDEDVEVCVVLFEPGLDSLDESFFASVLLLPTKTGHTAEGEILHVMLIQGGFLPS